MQKAELKRKLNFNIDIYYILHVKELLLKKIWKLSKWKIFFDCIKKKVEKEKKGIKEWTRLCFLNSNPIFILCASNEGDSCGRDESSDNFLKDFSFFSPRCSSDYFTFCLL